MEETKKEVVRCRERLQGFLPRFLDIAKSEMESYDVSEEDVAYYSHAIQYNLQGDPLTITTGGKLIRGTLVALTTSLMMGEEMTDHAWHQALLLGWCVELLQTAFLVADDIMDNSVMRRSNVCWYRVPTIGISNAVNDTMFLNTLVYRVISHQLKDCPKILAIHELFNKVSMATILGQHMDSYDAMDDSLFESSTAATSLYHRICKNKTSYYTFYLPIKLGMIICGVDEGNLNYMKLESVSCMLGHMFQAQDDFLDCYGDSSQSGKEGTDIQTKKCTWLLATAIHVSNEDQLRTIRENIGKNDIACVEAVKRVYKELKLPHLFKVYSQELKENIQSQIRDIESKELAAILQCSLDTIANRQR